MADPLYRWVPPAQDTAGDLAVGLAAQVGMTMDAHQCALLDAIFGENEPGIPAAFEVGTVAPRQNIKTSTYEIAALTDLFILREPLHVWTAHLFSTTRKSFDHMKALIARTPDLKAQCKWPPRASHGEEALELLTGETIEFRARSTGSGRGFAGVSRVTYDEALFLSAGEVGASLPTLATMAGAQVRYGSSAGLLGSAALREVRNRGRRGGDPGLVWVEYGAPVTECEQEECPHTYGQVTGCALDREELWFLANPTLGDRITLEIMRKFRRAMTGLEFAREFLSWWEDPADEAGTLIDPTHWATLVDRQEGHPGSVAFGVTVLPDRTRSTIGVAVLRADGRVHVETAADAAGTDWVTPWLAERQPVRHPCAVVLDGTAAPLLPGLRDAGIENLVPTTSGDRAAATAGMYDAITASRVTHPNGPKLNMATAAAGKRIIGNGWVWEGAGIGPLVGATLARQGVVLHGKPPAPPPAPRPISSGGASEVESLGF